MADKPRLDGWTRPGSSSTHSKLTEEKVREIRKLRKLGMTYKYLGERFGVSETCCHKICAYQTWQHVPEESTLAPMDLTGAFSYIRQQIDLATGVGNDPILFQALATIQAAIENLQSEVAVLQSGAPVPGTQTSS